MSDHDPRQDTPAMSRMSTRRLAGLALGVGVIAGLAAVYGMGGFDGNEKTAGKCAAALARASSLKPYSTGDIAAFAAASAPRDLSDLAFTGADGKPTTLAAWRGKTVLLNLWATWCGPCRKEMPSLDRLQATRGGADFDVVTVNLDTRDPEKPKAFLAETGVKALAHNTDSSFALFRTLQTMGLARGLPTTLLVDRDGCEMGVMAGPAEWDGKAARGLIEAAVK